MKAANRHRQRDRQTTQARGSEKTGVAAAPLTRLAPRRADPWVALALFAFTALLYAPSLDNGFVDLDDPDYLTNNPHVQGGLTPANVRWAFTTGHTANWMPLTWLSHMLMCDLFGLNPAPHHAANALLHAATAAMVYLFLRCTTGYVGRSLTVALFFAVHPLRVESVAWVTERKDVLCGAFFGLALLAYVTYCRRPRAPAYAGVLLAYALGLMSKPMVVTLPFLLLLLDYWPLRRLRWSPTDDAAIDASPAGDRMSESMGTAATSRSARFSGESSAPGSREGNESDGTPAPDPFPVRSVGWVLAEKLPLLSLAVIASAITVVVQRAGAAMAPGAHLTLGQRLANAAVSVARYLAKTVRPVDLAVLYPHPGQWPTGMVVVAAALVLGISLLAVLLVRRRPYAAVGWFWFLGMLVPVIGIVQVGDQSMADRYTYLPSVGLTVAAVWSVADFARPRPRLRAALAPALGVIVLVLCVLTVLQQRTWRGTVELATHAIDADPDNWAARGLLASHLMTRDPNAALAEFLSSARGMTRMNRAADAAELCRLLAQRFPNRPEVHAEWGHALLELGRREEAAARFREALRLAPPNAPLRQPIEEELWRASDPTPAM